MKGIACVLLVAACAGAALCATIGNTTLQDDAWWGPENGTNKTCIQPFKIEFTDEMIADLRYRLKNHRPFTPPLENQGFRYGFNSDEMPGWIQYWAEEYPFAERLKFLNQYPQYKTYIQGLGIHYLHVKPQLPEGVEVVPLLLLHGWPGSVREFYEAIPLLTAVSDDRDFALEVIAPNIPGFGFSDGAVRSGMGATEIAVIFRNLMRRLGYNKFFIQGGDWGSIICINLATLFPEEVLGFHSNFPLSQNLKSYFAWYLGSSYPAVVVDSSVEDRMYPISSKLKFLMTEMGYMHIQATKPDSVGIALSDTPAGLLAYILQLMSVGTRAAYVNSTDGGFDQHYSRASLIDNLMIYWTSNSITTSCRIYAESLNLRTRALGVAETPTPVLTWTIHAKDEIFYQSPYLLKFKFPNLVHSTILETGGHFLALELPEVFAEDVLKAITVFRKIHARSEYERTEL